MRGWFVAAFVALACCLVVGVATVPSAGVAAVPAVTAVPAAAAVPAVPDLPAVPAAEPIGRVIATARATPSAPSAPAAPSATTGGDAALVDVAWAARVGAGTGIPARALLAYAGAALALSVEQPACRLAWNTLAALGGIESAHGTHGGSAIDTNGTARPGVFGPDLDGGDYSHIADSDGGVLDGSATGDRAVGPLQFIPSTWQRWGADGNADGRADPQQLDDAALAAGRYLCSYGDLSTVTGWRASVFAYNHLESYVDEVAATANRYAAEAG